MKKRKINKVLIIRPDAIGDFVSITPVLSALKKADPDIRITLLGSKANFELASNHPLIDEVIPDKIRTGEAKGISGYLNYINEFRERIFDAALVFYNELPYALLALLAGIPVRVGDKDKFPLTLLYNGGTHINNADQTKHVLEYNLQYVQALGFNTAGCEMNLPPPKADYPISGSPLIGIHLGYIGGTAAKRKLPPEKYIEAIEKIFGYYPSATVALLGTGEISGDSQDIAGRCRGGCVIDLVGKTSLPELISVIKKLSVYIGVETGPTQIAAAYKIPMVFINAVKCLKPQRWAPLHSPKVIVKLSSNCPFVCHYASCLDQRCSLSISTDEIANGVKELLDPGRRKNDEFRYSFAKSNNILFVADRLPAAADKLKALGFGVALYPPDEFNLRKFGALLDRMTLEDTTIVHSTIDRPFLFKLIELVSPSRLLTPPLVLYSREILDPAEKLIESYLERFRSKTHV